MLLQVFLSLHIWTLQSGVSLHLIALFFIFIFCVISVWQKLEEENADFFRAYYIRLKLKRQILLFNHLLERQYHLMKYPMPPKVPLAPIQNGIHPMPGKLLPHLGGDLKAETKLKERIRTVLLSFWLDWSPFLWLSTILNVIIIYRCLFAVQLIICLGDTQSYSNLQWLQPVSPISTPWAMEYQIVTWLMESLRQAISIPCGWILAMSENPLFNSFIFNTYQ